jgi:RecA-family ATPase
MEKFYYDSAYENPLTLVSYDDRGRPLINQKQIDYIVSEIKRREIILFVLDPFVECHQVNENDNGAINMVMRAFRKIAKETGCAISVVHHTSKGKQDVHGNMDKARGASSLASAARIAHTFYTMNEKEAAQYGITPASRRSWYSRLDSAKANL